MNEQNSKREALLLGCVFSLLGIAQLNYALLSKEERELVDSINTIMMQEHLKPQPQDIYVNDIPDYADTFSLKEWLYAVEMGNISYDDGCGYWCKGNKESEVSAFDKKPEDADSVSWYNK